MSVPAVLVVYNRPAHTRRVIESLRPHCPQDVFVFCDGPKDGASTKAVDVTRAELERIDWTEPVIVKRKKNAGLANSIVLAVDTILSDYDSMILLEDDCVVGPHFFTFMHDCLARYENNKSIVGVTGYTVPVPEALRAGYPYDAYFLPRPGSWGWATWADRWAWYERDFAVGLARARRDNIDLTIAGKDLPGMIQAMIDGKLDAWTPGWVLATARHGLFAYPTCSHVQNVGFDGTGVHCGASTRYDTPMATEAPSRYPAELAIDATMLENFRRYYG